MDTTSKSQALEITTHMHVDTDALIAVTFFCWFHGIPVERVTNELKKMVKLHFVRAGETGPGENIDTGGGKFDHHQPGREGECAASLVWELLPAKLREASRPLMLLALAQDLGSNIIPAGAGVLKPGNSKLTALPAYIRLTQLPSLIASQRAIGKTEEEIFWYFWDEFVGLVTLWDRKWRAEKEFKAKAKKLTDHVVFLPDCLEETIGIAFREGHEAVIFRAVRGEQIIYFLKRTSHGGRPTDLTQLRGWSGFNGEGPRWHLEAWQASWSTPKSPRSRRSQVEPRALAEAFETLYQGAELTA